MGKKFDRLIVHVGMHKTGSTTLQHMLKGMRWGRVGPMDMIDVNHSVPCSLWFGSALRQDRMLLNFGHDRASAAAHLAKVQERVMRQLKWSRKRELVISAEWLSDGHYQGEGRRGMLQRLKDTFEPHFEKIEVFGYVRPPVSYITSASQEMLKMRPGFSTPWANYRRRFGPLNVIFGRENVHLRVYDRARLKNGDIVSDFQEWVGWPQKQVKARQLNHGLSVGSAALIYCFQTNRPSTASVDQHKVKVKTVAALSDLKGPRFTLDPGLALEVLEENADDLRWIEEIMQDKISDVDTPVPDDCVFIAGEDDLKRMAAKYAPLLTGAPPKEPPDDPEEANALAWAILRQHFHL